MLMWLLALLAVLVGVFLFFSGDTAGFAGFDGGQIASLLIGGTLVGLYLLSLAGDYRGRTLAAFRHALVWLGLTLLLVAGYAFRDEIGVVAGRVTDELLPPGAALQAESGTASERAVRLRKHPNGHFVARGTVNGSTVALLVDTGASAVVLTPGDAARAGIDTRTLSFSVPVSTANGTTFAAPVKIRKLAVGAIELSDVDALVAQPGNLNESLLGMSFLRRLRSYEFSGDFLTLRG